jgi:pilus assembly protein CpaE
MLHTSASEIASPPVEPSASGVDAPAMRVAPNAIAIAVQGASGPESLLNSALQPLGFAPVHMVASLTDALAQLRVRTPTMLLVPVDVPPGELAQLSAELRRHPQMATIGTAPVKDADVVLAAMRAGISEFLLAPTDLTELRAAAQRLLQAAAGATASHGAVYTVYSAKGGLGTSTLATSLAWSLARQDPGQRVVLVDFTTTGTGIRVMLNANPVYDLGTVAARSAHIDADLLRSVVWDTGEQVGVLAAPDELDAGEPLDLAGATRLLELLRREYAYVVVDTDHHFADPTLAALDLADTVLLVTQPDISALRSTQRSMGVFLRLGYAVEKVQVVMNRVTPHDRISAADAQTVLGRPVDHRLPNDYVSCQDALTVGRFVPQKGRETPLTTAFARMAAAVSGRPEQPAPQAGSRLSRLFSRRRDP